MKILNQRKANTSGISGASSLPALCKALAWLVALAPASGLCGVTAHASGAQAVCATQSVAWQVFLYDAQGHAVDSTATTCYQEPHVYGLNGDLLGTVGDNGVIYNSAGQNIGYVIAQSGGISL